MAELEISEVEKLIGIKAHTLRYYESIGLIRNIKRNSSGKRVYSEQDLKWLEFITRLRATGMKISNMVKYAELRYIGDETVTERKSILIEHLISIEKEIQILLDSKDFVSKKIDIYNDMEEKINGKRK